MVQAEKEQQVADKARQSTGNAIVISRSTVYFVVIAVAFFILGYGVAWVMWGLTDNTRNEGLEDMVRSAVAEAFDEYDLAGGQAAAEVQPTQPPQQQPAQPAAVVDVNLDDDPALGPEDAPITIVEFSDFRCGFCGRFHQETFEPLMAQYEGQIRFVYRDFPVVGGEVAALASECADDQDVYWEYHDILFNNQRNVDLSSEDALVDLVSEIDGVDVDAFSTCLADREHQQEIVNDFNDGRSYGITGTPTFFINGRRLVGAQPLLNFQAVIDEILAEEVGG